MARSSLTQNYAVSSGTLFEDFEVFVNFTGGIGGGGASGSIAVDTTNFKTGTQGLQVNATNGGYSATKTISLNASVAGNFGFWVYIPSTTNLFSVTLYLTSSSTFVSFFSNAWGVASLHNGWNFLSVTRSSWTNTGSEAWENTMVRLRVRIDTIAAQSSSVTFDSLYYGIYARPKVAITFDDCFSSAFTIGYPYMSTYGMKGTFGVISSLIDTTNYMTLANLRTAYNNGWAMVNHTTTHPDLTVLSGQAAVQSEIAACTAYIRANDFDKGNSSRMVLYPTGTYNDTVIAAAQAESMLLGRSVKSRNQSTIKGIDSAYIIKAKELRSDTTTLTIAKAWVDNAVSNGETLHLFGHKLAASPAAYTEWSTSDFQSLIDYIQAYKNQGSLDVVTLPDWYNGLTSPRLLAATRSAATRSVLSTRSPA
jgi:peptidoglycan/xylan/chitin deacetylase (PgdA/CDA1 family)